MTRGLRHYELPSRFAERYRPVRVHQHEHGLAAFALDEYGLRFFRMMATGATVPPQAIWSLSRHSAESTLVQLVSGRHADAIGYVVCERPHVYADPAVHPVPRRLSYRAKVTIAALQSLLSDLTDEPGASAAEVVRFVERRIDQLRT
jgi:hypothetical protein